ncbi:hypothetical protein ACC699_03885 [Rhizobium ruizarguesonis]|nr:hypothetical protein [Rhizobium leguminosarum]
MQDSYDAFISYRRAEASALAHWIRGRLQRYRLPGEVLKTLSAEKRELHQRRPRIYLDTAYEKPAEDFLLDKIYPALDASSRLIVLSTPSAFDNIKDAKGVEAPNWLIREVDRFLGRGPSPTGRPLDVVLGPQARQDSFPGRLAEKDRWDWIDLRAFTWWRSWGMSEALDAGFTKLAAGLYNIPVEALPLMRQEERRRRRRVIAVAVAGLLVVSGIVGLLAVGWWNAKQRAQIVDAERRFNLAVSLVDSGAIPRAVDGLSQLGEDGLLRMDEAKRLLRAWSARLATASDQLAGLKDRSVFRWRGRNYLKTGGKIAGSYEGPPALESAVTSNDAHLVTFDADHVIRVRSLSNLDKPLLETPTVDARPGTISELLDGRVLMFDGTGLALDSDEDSPSAQVDYGHVLALLAPEDGRFATIFTRDNAPGVAIDCHTISVEGQEASLSWQTAAAPVNLSNGRLVVDGWRAGPPNWSFQPSEATASSAPAPIKPGAECQPRVLAALMAGSAQSPVNELLFPAAIEEKLLWRTISPVPKISPASICVVDEDGKDQVDGTCYAASGAMPVADHQGDLLSILRDPLTSEVFTLAGSTQRLVVESVTGNQSVGIAFCKLEEPRLVSRCLTANMTARSSLKRLGGNEYAAINSEEVFADSFQLVDLRNLRMISMTPSPGEKLADTAMSPDGARLAALTATGEVWIYDVHRDDSIGRIARRYDFRQTMNSTEPKSPTPRAEQPEADMTFSAVEFVDANRLLLAGAKGGMVLADVSSGKAIWTRPPLLPRSTQAEKLSWNAASDIAAVYDDSSAQLISLSSGALLSQRLDFASLAISDPQGDDPTAETSIDLTDDGSITINFSGHAFAPSGAWVGPTPDRKMVEQLTGIRSDGTTGPLDVFLTP